MRYEDARQHNLNRVRGLCSEAIRTINNYLEDAERTINREESSPERMIAAVLKVSWGIANATPSLQSALSALEDARKISEMPSEELSAGCKE